MINIIGKLERICMFLSGFVIWYIIDLKWFFKSCSYFFVEVCFYGLLIDGNLFLYLILVLI